MIGKVVVRTLPVQPKFAIGARVVCVDAIGVGRDLYLTNGKVYQVEDLPLNGLVVDREIAIRDDRGVLIVISDHRFLLALKFKVGDKVVCVNDQGCDLIAGCKYLVEDAARTGEMARVNRGEMICVLGCLYNTDRFELAETNKSQCTCSMDQLMSAGCNCGAFQKELADTN